MDMEKQIKELTKKGYGCSQILMLMALDYDGVQNSDLVRAVEGLRSGVCSKKTCGALTGGACFISYFAGKGEDDEIAHEDLKEMVKKLCDWFNDEFKSCDCKDLVGDDPLEKLEVCPKLISGVYNKCMSLLQEHEVL